MRIVSEPQVFLIATTKLEWEGLRAYLHEIGDPDWQPDPNVSDAENLIEAAGRLCYMSWQAYDPQKPRATNPNVTKVREGNERYLRNIIESQHGSVMEHCTATFLYNDISRVLCYTPETRILTDSGWKNIGDLRESDRLLTKNPKTHLCRWSPILSLKRFGYDGEIFWWETSQIESPQVTAEHLLWAAPYDLRRARGLSNRQNVDAWAEKIPAAALYGKRFSVDHQVVMESTHAEDVVIGEYTYDCGVLCEWLGWMATDGGFSTSRPNQCTIEQSKEENWPLIEGVMERLFPGRWRSHGPYGEGACRQFTISDAALAEWTREMIGPSKERRRFDPWVLGLHPNFLGRMLATAILGDGSTHHQNGHQVLYCPTHEVAEQWQTLVSATGQVGNIREDNRVGEKHPLPNGQQISQGKPCYNLEISRKSASLVKVHHHAKEWYRGEVICPQTADGLVFVKRTGHPVWSGNTHELVRHRAGMAYSQQSLRYIRLDDLGFWLPPRVLADEVLSKMFVDTVHLLEGIQKRLAEHTGINEVKNFHLKKQLTSMFRRLAPIGTATSIIVTGNLRSWRHIIAQRTSPGAEEEIRLVVGKSARILRGRYPNVFADMTEHEDGSFTFANPKV